MGTTTITINLDETDINANVEAGNLVQQACYEKLKKQIESDLGKRPKSIANETYPMGSGLVYFIDGTRGAGKSTFLLAAYHSLSKGNVPLESLDGKPIQLGKLAHIDPSRIERSEIILLPILKAIKQCVEEVQKTCSLKNESDLATFRKQFKKLAGGLSLFSKNHDPLGDIDAELFLDWGLERAENSANLRENLHRLIHTVCVLLRHTALVLAFDDADTNAKSAILVLECIRKYLDTPELVVLVTGDMELYSQQVRDHFHSSMGKHLANMDDERRLQRTKMVDHLEDQYLLKLFPMRRRILLRPIWNLIEHGNPITLLREGWPNDAKKENSRTLPSVVKELVRRGLRLKNQGDIDLYFEFLLKQPIRSVLQILSSCAANLASSDAIGNEENCADVALSDAFSESLRSMALGSLYKFGVDVDSIGAHEMSALVEAVFNLTVRDGDVDTGAYLRPQSNDPALRNSFAALSAEVAGFCAGKPADTLHYLLNGPGSVALWGQVQRRKGKDVALITDFKKYMGIGHKEDALNWAWHASMILTAPYASNPKRPVVHFGVIGLNKSPRNGVSARTIINSLDVAPAFAFSLIDASGSGVGTFASIFNILGLMVRLLRIKPDESGEAKSRIKNELAKVYNTPTISRPNWEVGDSVLMDEGGSEEDESEATTTKLDALVDRIFSWLMEVQSLNAKPSAVLLGKVWARLYFSLEKVSDKHRGELGAARLMELFALCVINAFLVEELDHYLIQNKFGPAKFVVNRNNPVKSVFNVDDKFEALVGQSANLPLTFLVARCPLILGLLEYSSKESFEEGCSKEFISLKEKYTEKSNSFERKCSKELGIFDEEIFARVKDLEKYNNFKEKNLIERKLLEERHSKERKSLEKEYFKEEKSLKEKHLKEGSLKKYYSNLTRFLLIDNKNIRQCFCQEEDWKNLNKVIIAGPKEN